MITITHSDIAKFLECRRAFNFGYIEDWKRPDAPVGALALGGRVHLCVEHFHRGGDPLEEHQRLAKMDEETLISVGPPSFVMDSFYEDVIIGRNCVLAFLDWVEREAPYHGYSVEPEVILKAPILGGEVELMGKADMLLTRDDDGFKFIDDLKTSNRYRAGLREELERSYQHWVYMTLVQLLDPEAVIAGSWYTVIFKAKNPARMTGAPVERWPTPAKFSQAPYKLRQIEEICREMLRVMERAHTDGIAVPYPTPGDQCRWCDFRHPCEMMEGNFLGARAMLDAEFVRGGRHGRYDSTVPVSIRRGLW